ncbi:DNA end protector [Acinetobacter phage Acj9]|uniref:Gp2 DNA end protector protein n=1 Tax=Acinetobacter phage Acj9 TaxID=760939 RepID=E5EPU1_9CAUD|nr:DNA end protector [Acinetobacter phage Acj9]ADG60057.1 gp2 DNA end protector protein [Acinetobacter phage Acj9]
MSIFQIDEAAQIKKANPKITRQELAWVNIGVRWRKAKAKGASAKSFAEENEINYETFRRSMLRYKSQIDLAYQAEIAKNKPKGKLTKSEKDAILINSFRQSMREKIKNDGAAANNKSEKWFKETLAKGVRGHSVVAPVPGKLYAFIYDAKHKDKLPFWDKYPLIIFLGASRSKTAGTALLHGLNLHYIPPKARQQFLEELLKNYSSTGTITNSTKLKIDWSKVKGFNGADKMIKSYLPGHVKGRFVEIKPSDWSNVVLMPLQSFQSQGSRYSANKVWR